MTRRDDAALPLDALLTESARGPLARLLPVAPAARLAGALVRRPTRLAVRGAGLVTELGRIAGGGAGPRLDAAHRATRAAVLDLVDDVVEAPDDAERLRFAATRIADLLAPDALPRTPADLRTLAEALRTSPRLPDGGPRPEPGTETATAPGAVVLRTPVCELVQYLPATERVGEVPVLVVPGFVNRVHLVDLAPDRSLVAHLVGAGVQVLALSWRDPSPAEAHWDLDTYAAAVVEALDAVETVCRVDRTTLFGLGAGGLLAAAVTARLERQERVAALVLAGTAPGRDAARTGPGAPTPVDEEEVAAAVEAVTRAGRLDGSRLAELHALLCPEVLLPREERGEPDPLRAWNIDTLHVPAGLYRDLTRIALAGEPDLAAVDRDVYLLAGIADRLGSWQGVYRTTQALGGKSRFVLVPGSTAAAVGYGTTAFRAADDPVSAGGPVDPERWRAGARLHRGSWWADLTAWLDERSGGRRDAPPELGGRGLHPLHPAPGTYVRGTPS
jgi:polyhydroxyalkanoate synthase subunit PhaC